MRKICIIVCSVLVAATLALGVVSSTSVNAIQEEVTLCDMEFGRVSY